jgi:hypothetical protein
MADYGIGRTGGSLRDALNQLYPMTGLGEYGAMFPPQTGSPQPSGPVPMPQPRPQMPPGALGVPPPGMGPPTGLPPGVGLGPPPGGPPGLAQAPGLQGNLALGGGVGRPGMPGGPQVSGGVGVPLGQNAKLQGIGRFANPQDYAAQLRLAGQF